jgi:hypothetical protein
MGFVKFYRRGLVRCCSGCLENSSCAFCIVLVGLYVYSSSMHILRMGVLAFEKLQLFVLDYKYIPSHTIIRVVFCL